MRSVTRKRVRISLAVRVTPGKPLRNKGKPARDQDKEACDDESDGGDEEETSVEEFQKATDALCVDGGASLHSSHHQTQMVGT